MKKTKNLRIANPLKEYNGKLTKENIYASLCCAICLLSVFTFIEKKNQKRMALIDTKENKKIITYKDADGNIIGLPSNQYINACYKKNDLIYAFDLKPEMVIEYNGTSLKYLNYELYERETNYLDEYNNEHIVKEIWVNYIYENGVIKTCPVTNTSLYNYEPISKKLIKNN